MKIIRTKLLNQQNQLALLLAHVNEEIRMADIQKVRDVMMSTFTKVEGIMSKPVLSVKSDMPIPFAARFLTNFNVSCAMVIENNEVIGMVSLNGMVNNWED